MGTAMIAVPIYRQSNTVQVDVAQYRYTWVESGRNQIILPVGGRIQFYQDKNWFIILDSAGKKHKFGLVGQTVR
jgi:hypothetical protein